MLRDESETPCPEEESARERPRARRGPGAAGETGRGRWRYEAETLPARERGVTAEGTPELRDASETPCPEEVFFCY